jgi:L-amino acid ligase C-terminal domain 2/ATP-grasp domain
VTPSRLSGVEQTEIERSARDSVRALGLTQGPVHAEFRVNEDGVWPLEVAPRPIGGLCARALRFAGTGGSAAETIGLEELLLRHAVGLPGGDWEREAEASGVMMIPVPKSGVLEGVDGVEVARGVAGITDVEITARVHDFIASWPEGSSYLGFLFAQGDGPAEVERALRAAHAELKFRITERLAVEHPATGKMVGSAD